MSKRGRNRGQDPITTDFTAKEVSWQAPKGDSRLSSLDEDVCTHFI